MGDYDKLILMIILMGVWTALCVWATLMVVSWTLIRSTHTGGLTPPAENDEERGERDFITPEFYVAQGFADMPRENLLLDDDEDVELRLHKEGL